MARSSTSTPKEPGRLSQILQVAKMTVQQDRASIFWLALGFFLPLVAAILLAIFTTGGNVLTIVLLAIAGLLAAILGLLIVLGRRAPRVAYRQMEGKPGAVGAVLNSALGRSWISSEMPVAINPRSQDAVYRAVGKAGIVLIAEGPRSRTQKLIDEETRKVNRILPGLPTHRLQVGPDEGSLSLEQLPKAIKKLPKKLKRREVQVASARLNSLAPNLLPIPKGIDPTRVRGAGRPR